MYMSCTETEGMGWDMEGIFVQLHKTRKSHWEIAPHQGPSTHTDAILPNLDVMSEGRVSKV